MLKLILSLLWASIVGVKAVDTDKCNAFDSYDYELEVELDVEFGWPVAINCNDVMEMIEYDVIHDDSSIDIKCDIIEGNSDDVVHTYNSTYHSGSFIQREASEYVINEVVEALVFTVVTTVPDGRCWSTQLYIDPRNSTLSNGGSFNENEYYNEIGALYDDSEYYEYSKEQGKPKLQNAKCVMAEKNETTVEINHSCTKEYLELNCEVPYKKLPIHSQSFEVTWYRDCIPLDRRYYSDAKVQKNRNHFSTIRLPPAEQYAGVYTCKVALLNSTKERFLVHHRVCFTMSEEQNTPDIKPEKITTYVSENELDSSSDVTIACSGHVNPNANPSRVEINWYRQDGKSNESICVLTQNEGGSNSSYINPHFFCSETSNITRVETLCEPGLKSCKEFNVYSGRFRSTLTIRGMTSADITSYYCQALNVVGSSIAKIDLEFKSTPFLPNLRTILAISGTILITVIFGIILWKCFKLEIKLLKRKYFDAYESADKEYTIFISYSFKLGITSKEDMFILKNIQDWLSSNSYSVYDHYQKGVGELRFSEVERVMPKCHRMMFFVNSDFIKDQESLFDAYAGVVNYIKNSTKLIFVIVPSVTQELQAKLKENNSKAIDAIMKQRGNSVIKWRKNDRTFFKELKIAMPKLDLKDLYVKDNSIATNNNSFSVVV